MTEEAGRAGVTFLKTIRSVIRHFDNDVGIETFKFETNVSCSPKIMYQFLLFLISMKRRQTIQTNFSDI